jgi:hypothetical protein
VPKGPGNKRGPAVSMEGEILLSAFIFFITSEGSVFLLVVVQLSLD